MNCLAIRSLMDLFTEELLTAERQAQVEAHIAGCRACREMVERRATATPRPVVKAPADLKARLKKALATSPGAQSVPLPPLPSHRDGRTAFFALFVFAVSLAALHALTPKNVSEHPTSSQSSPWRLP